MNDDTISRKWLMECVDEGWIKFDTEKDKNTYVHLVRDIAPSAQPEREDYTEMKREFIRMAGYIDSLLVCSDEQKETLMNFISRLAEFMPWTERD